MIRKEGSEHVRNRAPDCSGEEEHYDSSPSPGSCYDTASESAPYGPDSGNFNLDSNTSGTELDETNQHEIPGSNSFNLLHPVFRDRYY